MPLTLESPPRWTVSSTVRTPAPPPLLDPRVSSSLPSSDQVFTLEKDHWARASGSRYFISRTDIDVPGVTRSLVVTPFLPLFIRVTYTCSVKSFTT